MLFDIINLPYWIFLDMGILLYWVVILSGGGEDDIEVDADADIDTISDFGFLEVLGQKILMKP